MTDQPSVVQALAAVMGDVRAVAKADRNTDQNYRFRGVDAVMNAVGPALRKHGVIVMPVCEQANYRDVTTSRGKPSRECTVMVRYRFYGPAGDFVEAVAPGESMDFGDKGAPKAMSVAYRIVLLQALCLPTDDPEPDAATFERGDHPEQSPNGAQRRRQQSVAEQVPTRDSDSPASSGAVQGALRFVRQRADREGIPWDDVQVQYARQYQGEVIDDATDPNRLTAFAKLLAGNGAPA